MKRFSIIMILLLIPVLVFGQYLGDSLGNHKARMNIQMQLFDLLNGGHFSFVTGIASGTVSWRDTVEHGQFTRHYADPNTYRQFTPDAIKFVAGGLVGLCIIEDTIDKICFGDDAWDFMIFGDSTTAGHYVSTYTYATRRWSFDRDVEIVRNLFIGATVQAPTGNFDEVVTSTIHAKSPLYISAPEVTVPALATYDGVDVSQLQEDVDSLSTNLLELYMTDELPSSFGYNLMTTTVPGGAESTIIKSMNASTVVVGSFTVESPLDLTSLRSGVYHWHFHAEMNNTNRDVRIRGEVWKSTGSGETFLFDSEQSNLMTANKSSYDIHVATEEIIGAIDYIVVKIVADVIGVASAPNLTFYMEGSNATSFEMPVLLGDIGVTKIIEGTNINITPTDGRDNVTVNVDESPEFQTVGVDSITANNNDYINLMDPTTYYGSQWGRGHDSKGWDNSSANSFTVEDEYTLPTADGNNNDVMSTNGAGTLSWNPPSGGGSASSIDFFYAGDIYDSSDTLSGVYSKIIDNASACSRYHVVTASVTTDDYIIQFSTRVRPSDEWALAESWSIPAVSTHTAVTTQHLGAKSQVKFNWDAVDATDPAGNVTVLLER